MDTISIDGMAAQASAGATAFQPGGSSVWLSNAGKRFQFSHVSFLVIVILVPLFSCLVCLCHCKLRCSLVASIDLAPRHLRASRDGVGSVKTEFGHFS